MIKKIKYLLFFVICNIFMMNVYAAGSAKITATASSSKVQVGDTVTVTVTVSSGTALGSWKFSVGHNSDILTFQSSTMENGLTSAGVVSNASTKNKSYTLKFKAKKAGTAKVTINNAEVYGFDESLFSITNTPATITVVSTTSNSNSNKPSNSNSNSNNKKQSANNLLSSLVVENYTISPKFDKNTTKYSVSVPNEVRKVRINAKAEDSKATITGVGDKELKEGNNEFEIVVRAENGNKKTYVVNITVKEQNPLTIKIDNDEYTVIQKRDNIEAPSNYKETTLTINEREVPAYTSDVTKFTLVGLIDKDGNSNLYVYSDDELSLYKEYKFNGIVLYIKEPSDNVKIKDSKETKIKIDDDEIIAYTIDSNTYPLLYGMNVETGEYNWYTYDESENTLQKFVTGNKNGVEGANVNTNNATSIKNNDKFKTISYVLAGITGIVIFFLIIAGVKLSKQSNKIDIE